MTILQVQCRQCVESDGQIERRAMRWAKEIGSYTERCEEINGIRIYVEGDLPRGMTDLEPVDSGWSIKPVSGNPHLNGAHIEGTPDEIRYGQKGVNALVKVLTAGRGRGPEPRSNGGPGHKPAPDDWARGGAAIGLREPPNNIEAEAALLGSIMLEPSGLAQIEFLKSDHFYDPVHAQILTRIRELVTIHRPVDPIALARAFAEDPELKKLPGGARGHLGAMARAAETIIEPAEYARELYDLALKRCVIKAAEEAINRAYDASLPDTGPQILSGHSSALTQLQQAFSSKDQFEFIAHADLADDLPPRAFLVEHWVPLGCVATLYGAGGTGKSFLAMMLAMCVAAGKPWLGYHCRQTTVLGVMCEDDEDELRRRRNKIARALNISRELLEGRLFLTARVGLENAMMDFPQGLARRTELFEQIIAEARRIGAHFVILDNAAQLFGGNEIDRAQVTAFMNAVAYIALQIQGAVLLLGHPPKNIGGAGNAAKWSGSTAWDAVTRSRIWFKRSEDDDENADPEAPPRYVLELAKANYARPFTIELAENSLGVVEFVSERDPRQKNSSRGPRAKDEETLDALHDLYRTHQRPIALDDIVAECIRRGSVREAAKDTAAWRDRRRTIRTHLHKQKRVIDDRGDDTFAIKPEGLSP